MAFCCQLQAFLARTATAERAPSPWNVTDSLSIEIAVLCGCEDRALLLNL